MAKDIYYDNVVLLLHGDGANGGTSIIDHSKYAYVPASTSGASTVSDVNAFGGSSIQVVNSGTGPINYAFTEYLGTGDFTFEVCYEFSALPASVSWFLDSTTVESKGISMGIRNNGNILFFAFSESGGYDYLECPASIAINTRAFLKIYRKAGVLFMILNNAQIGSKAFNIPVSLPSPVIGSTRSGAEYLNGKFEELRITKGIARDLPVAQTEPFPDSSPLLNLVITESIAATDFIVPIYAYQSGELIKRVVVSAGTHIISVPTAEAVMVMVIPDQGDSWKPATVYAINDLVFPTDPITSPFYYKRLTSGTSGATEPTWSVAGNDNDSSSLVYTIPDGSGTVTRSAKLHTNDGSTDDWLRIDRLAQPVTIAPLIPE